MGGEKIDGALPHAAAAAAAAAAHHSPPPPLRPPAPMPPSSPPSCGGCASCRQRARLVTRSWRHRRATAGGGVTLASPSSPSTSWCVGGLGCRRVRAWPLTRAPPPPPTRCWATRSSPPSSCPLAWATFCSSGRCGGTSSSTSSSLPSPRAARCGPTLRAACWPAWAPWRCSPQRCWPSRAAMCRACCCSSPCRRRSCGLTGAWLGVGGGRGGGVERVGDFPTTKSTNRHRSQLLARAVRQRGGARAHAPAAEWPRWRRGPAALHAAAAARRRGWLVPRALQGLDRVGRAAVWAVRRLGGCAYWWCHTRARSALAAAAPLPLPIPPLSSTAKLWGCADGARALEAQRRGSAGCRRPRPASGLWQLSRAPLPPLPLPCTLLLLGTVKPLSYTCVEHADGAGSPASP